MKKNIPQTDTVVTHYSGTDNYAIAAVNKSRDKSHEIILSLETAGNVEIHYICGAHADSYNDIDHTEIEIIHKQLGQYQKGIKVDLMPHSVNVIYINS